MTKVVTRVYEKNFVGDGTPAGQSDEIKFFELLSEIKVESWVEPHIEEIRSAVSYLIWLRFSG